MKPAKRRSVRLLLLNAALCCHLAVGQQSEESTVDPQLVAANNKFGFALLQQLQQQDGATNVFYSPLSITQALSMVYNGAGGSTQQQMRRVLGLERFSLEQLNQSSHGLLKELGRDEAGLKLTIANSLWARQGIAFDREFLDRNQRFYQAAISMLDFGDPGSVATINDWVARSTNGKIPTIIGKLAPADALVLINAVYFKAEWWNQFQPSQTRSDAFYLPGGGQIQVSMMNSTGILQCYAGQGFRAVRLPYAGSGAYMDLILPEKNISMTKLLRKLDDATYRRWTRSFRLGSVTLKLPRVELQYDTDLNTPLQALGMKSAFTRNADFSAMTRAEKLFVSKVKHRTTLEIDENGTEAAAATTISVTAVSARRPAPPPFTFIANRPFLVLIADRKSEAILFMGMVMNPQAGND